MPRIYDWKAGLDRLAEDYLKIIKKYDKIMDKYGEDCLLEIINLKSDILVTSMEELSLGLNTPTDEKTKKEFEDYWETKRDNFKNKYPELFEKMKSIEGQGLVNKCPECGKI